LQSYGQLPLHFEANQGQLDPQVAYFGRGPGYNLFITQTGQAVLDVHQTTTTADGQTQVSGDVITMSLGGASTTPQVVGLQPLGGTTNYFLGSDPQQWVTNVPTFAQVEVQNVYPGINLDFHAAAANAQQMEYDFTVQPGADPSQIQLNFDGAQGLTSDGQGGLLLQTSGGTIDEQAPVLYQLDSSATSSPSAAASPCKRTGRSVSSSAPTIARGPWSSTRSRTTRRSWAVVRWTRRPRMPWTARTTCTSRATRLPWRSRRPWGPTTGRSTAAPAT
jgi:hypothetical protein